MSALPLIKHAMPEIDSSVPAKRWSLGAEGQRQARELAGRLFEPDHRISGTEHSWKSAALASSALSTPPLHTTCFAMNNCVYQPLSHLIVVSQFTQEIHEFDSI